MIWMGWMAVLLFSNCNSMFGCIVKRYAEYLSYCQQQVQNFGEPFFMVIREDETLSSIKERIQKKLKVPDEDFSKVMPISLSN